jgi:hypothetical protein
MSTVAREALVVEAGAFDPSLYVAIMQRLKEGWTVVRAEIVFERTQYPEIGAFPTVARKRGRR